jgi:PhoH-like ATPase
MSKQTKALKKLFVLDTNVLLHDPSCIFRFHEHDVFIPMMTLEELDAQKKGTTDLARSARQSSRFLESVLLEHEGDLTQGIALSGAGDASAQGWLFLQTEAIRTDINQILTLGKADNEIIAVAAGLAATQTRHQIVLVSKDINMRIKARALGLVAEDYFSDKAIEDSDVLYSGSQPINGLFWEQHAQQLKSWQENGRAYYELVGADLMKWHPNEFIWDEGLEGFVARVIKLEGKVATLETLRDYTHQKNAVWGVTARNREQNFALNLLMNPDIDFVSISGTAGTGKTMLTLAAALHQVLETQRYADIIMTRATVPVGEDIGFLPGTEEEKMAPWMGALEDNLEVLTKTDAQHTEWAKAATRDLLGSKIKVKSMSFMRGRTFLNKFVIIDEAQNLSPKQMKTLISRAGPGTKIVCLGNLAQIDTPYLTSGSSGLTYVVDRFKEWEHAGHITLTRGERSRLADFVNDHL